ncbi:FadR/GntR family transcriptional regulator [Acidocella sp.]|uniref:FadR/GntR family transcriptional regulator n=1 Tax=Acidocella sp. TaxID=50710 RepID=UPI0026128648|nr:FCD domain-containing protein [Acidocella sp.]
MPEPIRPVKLAEAIAERIQTMILEGVLKPGEKLIAERELAEALGVSRPSLRDGLALLEEKGLLVTSKGGTVVARFLDRLADPLAELLGSDERAVADYFEFRLMLEPQASALAAERATEIDRGEIARCVAAMRAAHGADDPTTEANADVALHTAVYEATHNVFLLHIMTVLADLLRKNIFYNRDQLYRRAGVRDLLLEQHLAIGEAVLAGDAAAAEAAASAHIRFTRSTTAQIREEEARLATSLRRIERADVVQSGK